MVWSTLNEVDNKLTAITFTDENGDQVSVCSVACVRVRVKEVCSKVIKVVSIDEL